jgi:hypothetical protein
MRPRTALPHLLAELRGVRIHGIGSSRYLLSDTPARWGHLNTARCNPHSPTLSGGEGPLRRIPRHAALIAGTDLAPLKI